MKWPARWHDQHGLREKALFAVIVLAAFFVRTYHLSDPLGDWHSFRQADTASVTREFVKNGIDLLRPQYQDLSNIQSGHDNLEGWRMVEFPLINGMIAAILQQRPSWDLVVVSRVASILASLGSLTLLFLITRQAYGKAVAFLTAGVFAFIPYSVYYSRVILPEPFVVFFALTATMTLFLWGKTKQIGWLALGTLCFALALLTKPMAIFFLPFILGVWWRHRHFNVKTIILGVLSLAISVGPVIWWREWIQQFPSGIPASDWLLNGNGIRFRPAWWRWLFGDRMGRLFFGNWGAPFILLGGASALLGFQKAKSIYGSLDKLLQQEGAALGSILAILSYLVVFASGNVQHDYYQILIVPFVSILWARGAVWLVVQGRTLWQKFVLGMVVLITVVFSLSFAWYEVKGFFDVRNPASFVAGRAVDLRTPADAKVIAPGFGDTTLLFQTNRRGWPIGFEIEDKIKKGAQFYITTSQDDEANALMKRYPVIEKTDQYILLDLRQELP